MLAVQLALAVQLMPAVQLALALNWPETVLAAGQWLGSARSQAVGH